MFQHPVSSLCITKAMACLAWSRSPICLLDEGEILLCKAFMRITEEKVGYLISRSIELESLREEIPLEGSISQFLPEGFYSRPVSLKGKSLSILGICSLEYKELSLTASYVSATCGSARGGTPLCFQLRRRWPWRRQVCELEEDSPWKSMFTHKVSFKPHHMLFYYGFTNEETKAKIG